MILLNRMTYPIFKCLILKKCSADDEQTYQTNTDCAPYTWLIRTHLCEPTTLNE